jgi:hypothetical protein
MYEAHNAFVIRTNVPNNVAANNIRSRSDYAGFLILSRRWCGVDFINGLLNGDVVISLTDQESMYDIIDIYHRDDPNDKNRDSVTIQYRQDRNMIVAPNNVRDLPGGMRKDQFFLLFASANPISIKNKTKCFKIMTGVLPLHYKTTDSWAKCAGDQKDVGY